MPASPKAVLQYASTIAVVGASRDPTKPSGSIPLTMQRFGFRIIPVNPTVDRLYGEVCYKSVAAIPEPVDVVQVFRPEDEAPEIARQAVAIGAKALWLQSGIESAEARAVAESAGLDYIEDECMSVQRSLHGIDKRG